MQSFRGWFQKGCVSPGAQAFECGQWERRALARFLSQGMHFSKTMRVLIESWMGPFRSGEGDADEDAFWIRISWVCALFAVRFLGKRYLWRLHFWDLEVRFISFSGNLSAILTIVIMIFTEPVWIVTLIPISINSHLWKPWHTNRYQSEIFNKSILLDSNN